MRRLPTILSAVFAAVVAAVAQYPPAQVPATGAANVAAAAPAKKPGVIRLGLAEPKLEMGAAAAPEALRTLLTQYLSGPQIEVVPVTAMVPIQVEAEAKQKSCDYVSIRDARKSKAGAWGCCAARRQSRTWFR